jgi:hypothetical protein
MPRHPRSRPIRVIAAGWRSWRLLTVLSLALVLIIGGWTTSHTAADAHADTGAGSSVLTASAQDSGAPVAAQTASTSAGEFADASNVWGCLIGVVCTLLVLAVVTASRLQGRLRMLRVSRPVRAPLLVLVPMSWRPAAPSLLLLSISRT